VTTFDTLPVSRLRLLVPENESTKLSDIWQIARRGNMLTSYPYLVRAILSRAYGWGKVGSIQKIEGKVEALLASWYGRSAVDIVDTGDTAQKNNLTIWPTLFESYPVLLSSDEAMSENARVRSIVDALTMISNTLYENSPEYRKKYPWG
jgi:ATP phosphoribosyltransferase